MQWYQTVRSGTGCPNTRTGQHIFELRETEKWCRQCGLTTDKTLNLREALQIATAFIANRHSETTEDEKHAYRMISQWIEHGTFPDEEQE